MPWPIRKAVLAGLCHAEIADLGNEPMASLQCLDNIGFPLLLKPHLVGGLYATLAAVATPQPVKFTSEANVPLRAL